MRKSVQLFALLLLMYCALLPTVAKAQGVTTGAMNGIVTDKDGKPIAGVRVVATHEPSGTKYGAITNSAGRYNFPALRTGKPYSVRFSSLGLKEEAFGDITITLGNIYSLDVVMESADVKLGEVTVTSKKNSLMSEQRSGTATNISTEIIQSLPTLNRSIADFTRTDPRANGLSFGGQDARFINFTVDGSVFNNSFGLASLPGGQTNSTPISLDAIEEIQVSMAPYDVRQSGFVGAGINAITRKGDNQIRFSVFANTRNQDNLGRTAAGTEINRGQFNVQQYGFRIGGPIIENKLFFFLNGELENRTDPGTPNRASTGQSDAGANVVRAGINLADSLNRLREFLIQRFQYDPGVYQDYNLATFSAKATARLDYNVDENQKVSVRFNYLRSFRDVPISNTGGVNGRSGNLFALHFSNSNYRINNDIYSAIAEYNGTFGGEWFVNAQAGFTANRDYRALLGSRRMPTVDILLGGRNVTTFGDEPFTPNNLLNTDTWQAQANLTRYLGDHTLTAGFNVELFGFENGFTPEISGVYQFNSFTDFYQAVNGGNVRLNAYRLWFSALPGGEIPIARTRSSQIGFYLQDEWALAKNFRVTLGVRADVQGFEQTALANPQVPSFTFLGANGENLRFRTEQIPNPALLWAPRLGFNWDVTGDRTTQIRGGGGIFTGRVPFVIISNQVSNTGMFNGTYNVSGPVLNTTNLPGTTTPLRWSDNVTNNIPADASTRVPPASYVLNLSNSSFRFPQVFRANLAVDQELPLGIIGSLEGIFSQNVSAIFYRDVNLRPATQRFSGPDNRLRYPGSFGQTATGGLQPRVDSLNRINFPITNAILLDNTNQGNNWAITASLQKSFDFGLYANVAYTYSQSRDLADFGSIATTSFNSTSTINGNNLPDLTFSSNDQPHRFIANLSYRLRWSDILGMNDVGRFIGATQLSVFFSFASQDRITFRYLGDMNGDGNQNNDLMFVPADASQIVFDNLTLGSGASARTLMAADQWRLLDNYISNDAYLNSRRGAYAERNGGTRPMLARMDVSLTHDLNFAALYGGEKPMMVQFRLDIFNFLNMLDNNLGVADVVNNASPLQFRGVTADGRPRFFLAGASLDASGNPVLQPVLRKGTSIPDVWQMQFGVRVTFN
jgi:hypothetical protein